MRRRRWPSWLVPHSAAAGGAGPDTWCWPRPRAPRWHKPFRLCPHRPANRGLGGGTRHSTTRPRPQHLHIELSTIAHRGPLKRTEALKVSTLSWGKYDRGGGRKVGLVDVAMTA